MSTRRWRHGYLLALLAFTARGAGAQAVAGTIDDGDRLWLVREPGNGLPTPAIENVTGLPAGVKPHDVALFGPRRALAQNFGFDQLLRLDLASASFVSAIPVTPWHAYGTIAIAPGGGFALGSGDDTGVASGLTVVVNPFADLPTVRTLALPTDQHVHTWQSSAIDFADDGRAFVATHHRNFNRAAPTGTPNASDVVIVDPPYTTIAVTVPLPVGTPSLSNFDSAEGIAVTPDGQTVAVVDSDRELFVLHAPFSAGMAVTTLALGALGSACLSDVDFTPDGGELLVTDYCRDQVVVLHAPFDSTAGAELLPTPAGANGFGFEELSIAPDGALAYVTGNVISPGVAGLWAIVAPFTAAGAQSYAVVLPFGARGAGGIELGGRDLFADSFESGDLSLWDGP